MNFQRSDPHRTRHGTLDSPLSSSRSPAKTKRECIVYSIAFLPARSYCLFVPRTPETYRMRVRSTRSLSSDRTPVERVCPSRRAVRRDTCILVRTCDVRGAAGRRAQHAHLTDVVSLCCLHATKSTGAGRRRDGIVAGDSVPPVVRLCLVHGVCECVWLVCGARFDHGFDARPARHPTQLIRFRWCQHTRRARQCRPSPNE